MTPTNDAPVTVEEDPYLATIEEFEHEDQRELCRLYNHRPDDSLQFNRGNMREAIRHGRRLAGVATGPAEDGDLAGIIACMDQMLADPKLDALAFDKHDSRIIRAALASAPAGDGVSERDWIMRAFYAEIDRQCGIGAGMAQTCEDSGLFQINADIDMHSLAAALARPRAAVWERSREAYDALVRARDLAMRMTVDARIPECGHFGAIAQDLDAILALQSPPAKVEGV